MPFPDVEVPAELDPDAAEAIRSHLARLGEARDRGDLSDVVGCAKELVESVARTVLDARGQVLSNNASFHELVTEAHRQLDRQPAEGAASDPNVRNMAQSAKGLVKDLGQLRNELGTGHGRSRLPEVLVEHAELASDTATVWARWALRRLPAYINADLNDLLRHLEGGTFFRGTLRERLQAVGLERLSPADAQVLGVAIGRRTVAETFMVRIEGIDPVLTAPGRFPVEYRRGLIAGLLVDANGALSTSPPAVKVAVDLLLVDDDLTARLSEILPTISTAGWSAPLLKPQPSLAHVLEAAEAATERFPAAARQMWREGWQR